MEVRGYRERPRLSTRLDAAFDDTTRLTLLSAPPGYGKTVAVAGWFATRGMPFDVEGRDLRLAAAPKEFAEFKETINPIGTRVFFGALDPRRLGFRDRAIRTLPAGRALLPEGDFRDWLDIDAWATGIAVEVTAARAGRPTRMSS